MESIRPNKEQLARVEHSRQKALLIRQEKELLNRLNGVNNSNSAPKTLKRGLIDSGAGFFIEEDLSPQKPIIVNDEIPPIFTNSDNIICVDCGKSFFTSYLFDKFNHQCCDNCKDIDEKHKLITRTEAKEKYLLKDVDLDLREPPLMFILKKNPHGHKFAEMKLYLELQVAMRSKEIWENEQKLEEEKDKRIDNREKIKRKKYDKKIKALRMAVRSSLYRKDDSYHEHEYRDEVYNPDEDTYSKTCILCGHINSYEKM